jgi:hypothetical protein
MADLPWTRPWSATAGQDHADREEMRHVCGDTDAGEDAARLKKK